MQLYGMRDINMPTTTTNFTYTINDVNGNRGRHLHHSGLRRHPPRYPLWRASIMTKTASTATTTGWPCRSTSGSRMACRRCSPTPGRTKSTTARATAKAPTTCSSAMPTTGCTTATTRSTRAAGHSISATAWCFRGCGTAQGHARTDAVLEVRGQRLAALFHYQHGQRPSIRQRHHQRDRHAGSRHVQQLLDQRFRLQLSRSLDARQQLLPAGAVQSRCAPDEDDPRGRKVQV